MEVVLDADLGDQLDLRLEKIDALFLGREDRFEQLVEILQVRQPVEKALINAIVHRNYAIQGRGIEIRVFSDRLELLSPGRVLSTISIEDIRTLKGAHESRNRLVARVLREVGYVREMGEGIRRILDVMRSNALAEPDLQSNDDDFVVTLYHRSLYDRGVKLWLSLFDDYKLSEDQTAVLALGFEGKEFSTQDTIDRLGIVDTDQVRQILTPLRQPGLVVRTKNDAKAISISKARKIPKRAVPMFRVIGRPNEAKKDVTAADDAISASILPQNEAKLYLSNIDYTTIAETIVGALEKYCAVLAVELPKSKHHTEGNRGFAHVTVQPTAGTLSELLDNLKGLELDGRRLNVHVDE